MEEDLHNSTICKTHFFKIAFVNNIEAPRNVIEKLVLPILLKMSD